MTPKGCEKMDWKSKYAKMTDEELQLELLRLTNDSYLLRSEQEQKTAEYYERHDALKDVLDTKKHKTIN